MTYSVELRPSARKFLKKLGSVELYQRLRDAIDALAQNPYHEGSKRLVGKKDFYRVRVGDYRIIYSIENEKLVVLVFAIGHRREVYR